MIPLLVQLIVFCIVCGLIYYLITLLPLPEPFKQIVVVCVILIFILVLLSFFMGALPMPRWQQSMIAGSRWLA